MIHWLAIMSGEAGCVLALGWMNHPTTWEKRTMRLKDEFNAELNKNLLQQLRICHTQGLCAAIGSLISLRVPPEEIREVFDDALRTADLAAHTVTGSKTLDENASDLMTLMRRNGMKSVPGGKAE